MSQPSIGTVGLAEFAADVFAPLPRADQRVKAELYLRGLLTAGRRKSMRPMADRLGIDHQALQQFMTSSPWDLTVVRARLAVRAAQLLTPFAWVVDEVAFRKGGTGSACVARQTVGTAGKIANCQAGLAVYAVGAAGAVVVNWRLFVPPDWDDTLPGNQPRAAEIADRRRRVRVPDNERFRPKAVVVARMLKELTGWGIPVPVVAVRPGVHRGAELRAGLEQQGLRCVSPSASSAAQLMPDGLVRAAEVGEMVGQAHRELVDEFGLDHFEGRSWIGWNRHVSMTSAAQLFIRSRPGLESGRKTA